MAYRFKSSDRTIADGVRRIAADEFALIRAVLTDSALTPARKVHEGRKATKRLRALLRLTGPVMPGAKDEIAALREAARRLSALRDRSALAETLARLDLPEVTSQRLGSLIIPAPTATARGAKKLLTAFGTEMDEAAARAESWKLTAKGWDALEPGIEKTYRRFCRSMQAAKHAASEEPVHEFRKRAKDHWYHTMLLRRAFPEVMEGYAATAEQLCDDLGDWRDLGLLEHALQKVPAHRLAKPEAASALEIIGAARRRSLKRAFRTARLLTAEPASAYAARLEAWWRLTK